ncbi:MAG: MMPL family transporter [Thermoplasmata archaeon]
MLKSIIKYRRIVLIIWIIAIIAMVPLTSHYNSYINYGNSTSGISGTESSQVQSIISETSPHNSSLYVLLLSNPYNITTEKNVLNFQKKIDNSGIKNLSATESVYTSYASFLDKTIGKIQPKLIEMYNNFSYYSYLMLSFPSNFYRNYSLNYSIDYIANISGYNGSPYERTFLQFFQNSPANLSILKRINLALEESAFSFFHNNESIFYASMILKYANITTFPEDLLNNTAQFISGISKFNFTEDDLLATLMVGDFGMNYIQNFGLNGIPSFIKERFINSNSTASLILVIFNVPEGYISPSGFYPASAATPSVEKYVHYYFGNSGYLTGNGAIYYETQQQTSKSGAFFGAIYIILFIAVLLTLYSYKLSILNLILVSVTVLIGYLAIILSGIIAGKVSYVVTYTLTAVLLGITTDYVVFVLYRFRSELKRGKSKEEILGKPLSNSLKAVLISGLTVAFSLGMFTFVSSFETWGVTLLIAILITLLGVVTSLPAILSYLGPKSFMRKGLKREDEVDIKKSYFYRTSNLSVKKSFTVVFIIILLALPSVYLFAEYPTTYNFNAGLPLNLESSQGLSKLNSYFGENILYPVYVLIENENNSVNSSYNSKLYDFTAYLFSLDGTKEVVGPFSNGSSLSKNISANTFLVDNNKYVLYTIFINYNPYSEKALSYVEQLRSNKSLLVGGITSSIIDEERQNNKDFSELAILITIAIFIILAVSFRSIKYPIISLSGVFISIVWTLSILYFISTYILHQTIIYLIPVILFVILMSLGNDYSVFIFSRVREEQEKFGDIEGINRGMQTSGKVVTSLGLILAGSLGAIGLVPVGFLEQMGIAFAVSLTIDTMVVRTFYFPSMIKILRANFKS